MPETTAREEALLALIELVEARVPEDFRRETLVESVEAMTAEIQQLKAAAGDPQAVAHIRRQTIEDVQEQVIFSGSEHSQEAMQILAGACREVKGA